MFDCNTYVVKGNPSIIIDPGSPMFLSALLAGLHKDGIEPENIDIIVNTHLHGDHCGANEAFKQISGARINIHPVQKKFYDLVIFETAKLFGMPPAEFREDAFLDDGRLSAGDIEFELIRAPGHTPDCVCFYSRKDKILVCGDVIFTQSTGRADLPGGNADELRESVERLSHLEIEYLLPGHMDIVTGTENNELNFNFIKENVIQWL